MGSGSSTAGGKNTTTPEQRSVTRALTLPQFHRVIKSTIAEIHSIYLDPTGKVSSVLNDLTHSDSYELELLINGCSNSEAKIVTSQLQYAVENIIYEVSGIMDRLHFDDRSRILHIGDGEAFMLLIGMFITRGFVTTLLLKPVEYRLLTLERFTGLAESNLRVLATVLLYIVRQVSVIRGKANMGIPRELQRFVFTDEEMRPVYGRLTKAIGYGERLLKDWGVEYIRRLRIAQQYEEEYR